MSNAGRVRGSFRGFAGTLVVLVCAVLFMPGCDDDDAINLGEPYRFRFSLAADFGPPHGGQPVEWVLIRSADQVLLASGDGTISPTANPAFLLNAGRVLQEFVDYELRYWIDSNTGGGTAGVCDSETIDHQWNYRFQAPGNNVDFTLLYDADRVEDVCASFPL